MPVSLMRKVSSKFPPAVPSVAGDGGVPLIAGLNLLLAESCGEASYRSDAAEEEACNVVVGLSTTSGEGGVGRAAGKINCPEACR